MLKILFVAPRVHQNQVPIIQGLINSGNEVSYFVQRKSKYESYDKANVFIIPALKIYKVLNNLIAKYKGLDYAEQKAIYYFIPDKKHIKSLLDKVSPEVVILRNRTIFSLMVYNECRKKNCKILLYNQTAKFSPIEEKTSNRLMVSIVKRLIPLKRITVVRYRDFPKNNMQYKEDKEAFFLPFVARKTDIKKQNYCSDGIVKILDSGKFRDYKNHFFVVDAAKQLVDLGYCNFRITIQGQMENDEEKMYFEKLQKYIEKNKLESYIELMSGLPYDEMEMLFLKHDAFVLASKREIANISIIDAMKYGLATISTSANGTSDYIIPEVTGYVYNSGDLTDLVQQLQKYLDNMNLLKEHGVQASKIISETCTFEKYYRILQEVIEKI